MVFLCFSNEKSEKLHQWMGTGGTPHGLQCRTRMQQVTGNGDDTMWSGAPEDVSRCPVVVPVFTKKLRAEMTKLKLRETEKLTAPNSSPKINNIN